MITTTPKVAACIDAFVEHFKEASLHYDNEKWEDAIERFRKAAEAFMKIFIYNHLGDTLGQQVLDGMKDFQGNDILGSHKKMMLKDMIDLQDQLRFWSPFQYAMYYSRIKDLQLKGNLYSHDNDDKQPLLRYAILCRSQIIELAHGLYSDEIRMNIPEIFEIVHQKIQSEQKRSDWMDFFDYVEGFENRSRYILIAPSEYERCTLESLRMLRLIRWSTIVDFNPSTKENGLYKSFGSEVEEKSIPLMITQINEKNIASNSSGRTINWIFANGLKTVPETVTDSFKTWRQMKYHKFISNIIEDSNKNSISRICVVFFDIKIDFLNEIVRALDDIETIDNDLIRIAYCVTDIDKQKDADRQLEKYALDYCIFNLSLTELASQIASVTEEDKNASEIIFIPGKTQDKEDEVLDVTRLYSRMYDSGIQIVHQNIAESCNETETPIPAFYKGSKISWRELSEDIDVMRECYDELRNRIVYWLENAKQSVKFELSHQPGAGGTTLSRRLAYSLRKKYPTIILSSCEKNKTYEKLYELAVVVKTPILAFVEASEVKENVIMDLIERCNKQKQVVVFVVIKRELKKKKNFSGNLSLALSDKIKGNEEKFRFVAKLRAFIKNEDTIKALVELPVSNSEVIDYALALSQDAYDKKRLTEYVKEYINHLPEEQVKFVAFVSIIYHYAQLKVSYFLFRKMFKQDIEDFLRKDGDKFILKLLLQESENGEITEYWRPRFSVFAEIALHVILGKGNEGDEWKDQVPLYAKELISTIKDNNPILVEESEKILTSVFLERGNEDTLGIETEWNSSIFNEQFSLLLKDIGDNVTEQKNILLLLANSFPSKSHFWAHLGRFVYEKADNVEEYREALNYIERAFAEGGDTDKSILHVAGMCYRREIEYYSRNREDMEFTELKELTEISKSYFEQCREIEATNVHAYISEIQLLSCVLEYGMYLSKHHDFRQFLLEMENSWFLEQYELMNELIDDANIVLQQKEQLGLSNKLLNSKSKLSIAETRSKQYMGDYKTSLPILQKMLEKASREQRLHLRTVYVRALLLSKVKGDKSRMIEAWPKLSDIECKIVNDYLTSNIMQDSSNIYSLRLWFDFVRYSAYNVNNTEIMSRLSMMYENSNENSLNRGQSAYYLMILKSVQLIKRGFNPTEKVIDEIKKIREECQRISSYDKYSYEWLQNLEGIKGIINYKTKTEKTELVEVSGTIVEIFSPRQGTIRLDCGIDAFFVPAGNFNRDKDVSERVLFKIGFRHDGLAAYDVHKENELLIETEKPENSPINIEPIQLTDDTQEKDSPGVYKTESELTKPAKPVILGKIDLSTIPKR